jgi:hypothetical protein
MTKDEQGMQDRTKTEGSGSGRSGRWSRVEQEIERRETSVRGGREEAEDATIPDSYFPRSCRQTQHTLISSLIHSISQICYLGVTQSSRTKLLVHPQWISTRYEPKIYASLGVGR